MKIKRFGEGRQQVKIAQGTFLTFPGIMENPDGEYVRWEDYKELLDQIEAIGAGGVSGMSISKPIAIDVDATVIREWIANDAYAITFQNIATYRAGLLAAIDGCIIVKGE